MDLASFQRLLSKEGQHALEAAHALQPREQDFLAHFSTLNRTVDAELAKAALETAILRIEAGEKFPRASRMYFTREALEQATSYRVSSYRSERYQPFDRAVDLGCSIGGDTLALAAAVPTVGIDLDPLRLAMAAENSRVTGAGERTAFIQADLNQALPLAGSGRTALFFDPARRSRSRRLFSVEDYHPPLSAARSWLEDFPALGIKISPGVKLDELRGYDAEVEFISLKGELKEAVLWFGPLKTALRRATVLPGPHTLAAQRLPQDEPSLPLSEPKAYLIEPDPSILRAGMVGDLGIMLGASQLDPSIAYLTADSFLPTPYARAFTVEDWFPFQLKRLRAYLRERGIGKVTVKKRGSPLQPDALIQDLRLSGEKERILVLTQLKGKPVVLVCTI